MKKYIYTLLSVLMVVFASSCRKQSEGVTDITNYFQLYGAKAMYLGVGDEFVDPGYKELWGGGTVVVKVEDMTGMQVEKVSTAEPGFFTITYSVVNEQGLPFSMKRMVYIYDSSVTETLGDFKVDGENSKYGNGTSYATYAAAYAGQGRTTNDSPDITFKQVAGNIYSCSDLLGGWYTWIQGRGPMYEASYGIDFFDMFGYVTLNADMTITLLSSSIKCWGDSLDYLINGVYDPDTKTLSYDWSYANGAVKGHVVMVQQ